MGIRNKARRTSSAVKSRKEVITIKKGGLVFDLGKFTACKVGLFEAAINRTVLRVHIEESVPEPGIPSDDAIKNQQVVHRRRRRLKRRVNGDTSPQTPLEEQSDKDEDPRTHEKSLKSPVSSPNTPINRKKRKAGNEANERMSSKRYCLAMPPRRYNTSQSRLSLNFEVLKLALRTLKLPETHWKIRIWLRDQATTRIVITNNRELERSVTFNAKTNYYKLTVDNCLVHLLGSPKSIETVKEIEILLDILHCVDSNDCMIQKANDR